MTTTILLFGVTGMTGRHVLAQAAELSTESYRVVCFVRNISKIPLPLQSRVEIVQGDCCDPIAVSNCVKSIRPDVILLTTNIGFTNDLSKAVNKYLLPFIVDALTADERLAACRMIYLSGQGSPNPPITDNFEFTFIFWFANIKAAVQDNNAAHNFFHSCPPELNYTVVKMGLVSEGSSSGNLAGKLCTDDMLFGSLTSMLSAKGVKFCDVASFLLSIARRDIQYDRQYLWMEYTS